MTVVNEVVTTDPMVTDGVQREWPFGFRVNDPTTLRLELTSPAGVKAVVAQGFQVAGLRQGQGVVVYPLAPNLPLVGGGTVRVYRELPGTQLARFAGKGYDGQAVEDAIDAAAMRDQQLVRRFLDLLAAFEVHRAGNLDLFTFLRAALLQEFDGRVENDRILAERINGLIVAASDPVRIASVDIGNNTVVVSDGRGRCRPANSGYADEAGTALGVVAVGAPAGGLVSIRTAGELDLVTGGLDPGAVLFAAANGSITSAVPTFGYRQVIGFATSAFSLNVALGTARVIERGPFVGGVVAPTFEDQYKAFWDAQPASPDGVPPGDFYRNDRALERMT